MRRVSTMPRCSPPCAACNACPEDGAQASLDAVLALLDTPDLLLGGGDATRWPHLDELLARVQQRDAVRRPRVWLEAPAASLGPAVLERLRRAGLHGVVVQIEGVGEKLLRVMRAGDGERVVADAEALGLTVHARVIARPATFPMVLPLARRLSPRPIALEIVRQDWGKDPVTMAPDVIAELLLRAPNVGFTGYRAVEDGYLPPCVLPRVWATRPAAFRSVLREDDDAAVTNRTLEACASCALASRCRFTDRGALTDADAARAVPIADPVLPWSRHRTSRQAVPTEIVARRRAPAVVCTTPWTTMEIVDPDGRVRQCCTTWTIGHRGNVHDALLSGIWNGPGYQLARRQMGGGDVGALCHTICSRLHDQKFAETELRITRGSDAFVKNQLLLAEDIAERREIVRGKPLSLAICPSTYCNYNCIMCDLGRTPRRELPESIWDELPSLLPTLQTLTMLGGEPLANPSTMKFLREFDVQRYPDVAIDFVTNGALLTESVLARLDRCTLGDVTVSFNAGTPEVYAQVQRGIAMDKVLENLDALIAFRGRHHRWFGITLSFVVQPAASHTLVQFGELAHARNLRIRLMALNVENHYGLDFYVEPDVVARVLEDVDRFEISARTVRPEWVGEIRAARAAVAAEAVTRQRPAVPAGRRLPVVA